MNVALMQNYRQRELARRPQTISDDMARLVARIYDSFKLNTSRLNYIWTIAEIYILTRIKSPNIDHDKLLASAKYIADEYYNAMIENIEDRETTIAVLEAINYNADFATSYSIAYQYLLEIRGPNPKRTDIMELAQRLRRASPYRPSIVAIMAVREYCQYKKIQEPVYFADPQELPEELRDVTTRPWLINVPKVYKRVVSSYYSNLSNNDRGLGRGNFGAVRVVNIDGLQYAVKNITDDGFSSNFYSFIRETTALINFSDDSHFVQIQAVEMLKDSYNIVMQLCDISLADLIQKNPQHVYQLRKRYLYELLQATLALHSAGYVHRDLKPQNVLIENTRVKLADFGLAKIITDYYPNTELVYSLWYRPPEIMGGNNANYNNKADIWAIGCIMAEMITGRVLFEVKFPEDYTNNLDDYIIAQQRLAQIISNQLRTDYSDVTTDPIELDLLTSLLQYLPENRITADMALQHPYFADIS